MGIAELLQARIEELSFYSSYSFLREFNPVEQFQLFVRPRLDALLSSTGDHSIVFTVEGTEFVFLYEYLTWDSTFFNRNCYKLFTVLYSSCASSALTQAIRQFKSFICEQENAYCFIELPPEDVFLLQSLTEAGLKLVESRLHYYKQSLSSFIGERFAVREAILQDQEVITQLAVQHRNNFDRTHADSAFTTQEADAYLARYAQETLKGFCAGVLVPNGTSQAVDAFLAYSIYQETEPSKLITRYHVALAAVGPTFRGGLYKLLSELVYLAKEKEANCVTYTTQVTNRAAIRTCEKLGFSFARATHILTFSG